MKANELRALTEAQLKEKLLEMHKEQFNFRMQRATGQLSKRDQLNRVRKDIARVNTILAEKGVGA
jgi:large subunit ribosomal protein L29